MNFLERIINRIYQSYLRGKKEKKERIKKLQDREKENEKIYRAIIDFVKKNDIRKYEVSNYDSSNVEGEYKFFLEKIEIKVKVMIERTLGIFPIGCYAEVSVDSVWINASYYLKKRLSLSIMESTKKRKKEENEKTIEKMVATLEKKKQ